jgi:hypothetical protein
MESCGVLDPGSVWYRLLACADTTGQSNNRLWLAAVRITRFSPS